MKSILILGAFSDMSYAIAHLYAKQGYEIWLAGRNEEKLAVLEKDIAIKSNAKVKGYVFDARKYQTHQQFYEQLPASPDITFCVFGYLGDQENGQSNWDEASSILETNYNGAVSILNIVAQDCEKNKSGVIVGISSVAGLRGRQSNYLYGSAKAGFTAYLSGLRNRLNASNAHVVTVLPGFVATKMTEELDLPKALTTTPDNVAKKVYKAVKEKKKYYLCSMDLALYHADYQNDPRKYFQKT